ncbi:MAG: peptidylprolyl isomerase [Betaproteobacteria bacterium]|nr:peptidylprolyl isomerase [Betaproteobacteria bacterium]MDE2002973.1 peptidylprolyl isomerase [Betaproteobacteria bacterium]
MARRCPWFALLAVLLALVAGVASAQEPAHQGATAAVVPLDRVIVVVNDEALTQWDLNEERRVFLEQLKASNITPPPSDVLDKQVLQRLIIERALLQYAKQSGIRVDDTTVERTILRVAQENKLSPEEFRKVLEKEHIPYANYRDDLRRQIIVQRVREREVDSKVMVTDAEVDNYLATVASQAGGDSEYHLSHIYITVPEQATPAIVETSRKRAEAALDEIKAGKSFGEVAATFSAAPDASSGGDLGWRTSARLPTVFADVVRTLKPGEVSGILRSPAGFHIVKLLEIRSHNQPTIVEQTHARHILIKVDESTSEAEAKARIERLRERLIAGAKFEDIARANSEDASAAKGGDLGWLSPGDTVPDFEHAMDKLKIGEISEPVRSPFGWHLIEVLGRRKQDITKEREREQARQAIRQRKSDEQWDEFIRQLRDRTYVEYKTDDR